MPATPVAALNLTIPPTPKEAKTEQTLLCQLLLDEKRPQVRELPCAGDAQNNQLQQCPSNNTRVCGFGLISEFGFTLLYKF